jgi:membrane protein
MVLWGYSLKPLAARTVRELGEDRVLMLAGSAAFHFFFSLFPLLLFLVPVVTLVGDRQQVFGFLMGQLTSTLPPAQLVALRPVLENVVFSDAAPGIASLGLLLAAWSGSNIFGNLMGALNVAYGVRDTRPFWKKQLIRVGTFALGAVIVILSTITILRGEAVAGWLGAQLRLGPAFVAAWQVLQYPVAMLGLVALAFMTFWLLPDVRQRPRRVLVAAVLTTVLWLVATMLLRLYIQFFPPNPAYGFIGGVIIMLTWMYVSMLVVLLGGELGAELHKGTGAVAPRPGAIYLNRIVTGGGPGTPSTQRIEAR